ncbi:MAG: phospholipid transport system transporter-binding protein [Paraglaciecola sp.]
MTKLEIVESPKGYFTLKGELNRNTIAKSKALTTLEQSNQNNSSVDSYTLDMSGVRNSDTAGLAWLMNFLKGNQRQNVHFELKSIPESLIKLAKISDVDSFLSVQ